MEYHSVEDVEKIGKVGVISFDRIIGNKNIKQSRILSSFWLCLFDQKDGLAEHLNEDGYWESWITHWVSMNVQPASICIDAGATYGYYTYLLAQHGCKVYSIEANPDLIPLLEFSNYLNGTHDRVTIINKAVSNKSNQQIRLGFSDSIGGTSINANGERGSILVETLALDEILLLEPKIDFVKLDISSSEELAWEGMQRVMETNRNCICIMEFSPGYYNDNGKPFFNKIHEKYTTSYIDGTGSEISIDDYSFFEKDNQNWRMLVIRNKQESTVPNDLLSMLYALE